MRTELVQRIAALEADLASAEAAVAEQVAAGREQAARRLAGQRVEPLMVELAQVRALLAAAEQAMCLEPEQVTGRSWHAARLLQDLGRSRPLR